MSVWSALAQAARTPPGTPGPGPAVIGAGFGRTGTLSLKQALEDLGFGPTYHGEDLIWRPDDVRAWHRFAVTGETDWDDVLGPFRSAVDFPVACAWRELAEHYPEARIVLTVRDPDAWWRSMASTVHRASTMFPKWWVAIEPTARTYLDMSDRLIWDGLFAGRFEDREHARKVFRHHVDQVVATVPAERLLVFDVAQGWEPLCAFLGVPVPDHPFPRVNDARRMRWWITGLHVYTRVWPVALAAGAGLALHRRRRRGPG